jgi:hypothetical protein
VLNGFSMNKYWLDIVISSVGFTHWLHTVVNIQNLNPSCTLSVCKPRNLNLPRCSAHLAVAYGPMYHTRYALVELANGCLFSAAKPPAGFEVPASKSAPDFSFRFSCQKPRYRLKTKSARFLYSN